MRATEELVQAIASRSRLPSIKSRLDIQRELRTHIEDFVTAARNAGYEEHQIEELLRTHFGEPERIAKQFAWVYRHERRRLFILSSAASTLLMSGCLLMLTLAVQAGCAASLGAPVFKLLVSRHTFIEALDMLACVAIYIALAALESVFERHQFQKAALVIATAAAPIIVAGHALGLHATFLSYGTVTALFLRASRVLVPHTIARTLFVLACFALAGFGFAWLQPPVSPPETVATCISWLAVGAGYLAMTYAAPRLDIGFLNALQRY
jgi:hypothetical protein